MRGRPEIVGDIAADMLRRLSAGTWAAGSTLPPSRELCRTLGASRSTVLKALHRLSDLHLIRLQVRKPVLVLPEAASRSRRLLRRPRRDVSRQRRGLRLAILIPEEYLPLATSVSLFHVAFVRNLMRQAVAREGEATVVPLPLRNQLVSARSLADHGYQAAVCLGFQPSYAPALFLLRDQKFPVVLLNRRFPWLQVPAVLVDGDKPTRQLIDMLARHGHRDLCMISHFSAEDSPCNKNMVGTWTEHLEQRGLLQDCTVPLRVLPWVPALAQNRNLFADILLQRKRPTAVVLTSAYWVERFLGDPQFAPLRVPEDMSLAMFSPGENELRTPGGVPLTTLEINHRRAAECVLELAAKMLAGNPRPASIRIPIDLRLTDSIGPAPRL